MLDFLKNILPSRKATQSLRSQKNGFSKNTASEVIARIIQSSNYRVRQDVNSWRSALQAAENVLHPERRYLYDLYNELPIDNHLAALLQVRKLKVMGQPFRVINKKTGKEDKDKTRLLEREWFYQFMDYALDSIFYGYTLLEIMDIDELGEVSEVARVPFKHVLPEKGQIRKRLQDQSGFDYKNNTALMAWLIEIGKPESLGLLMQAAPEVLWKKNAHMAWSEFAEIFGMPMRLGKVNSNRDEDLDRMEEMLINMGSAAYAVFQEGESIEMVETTRTDAFNVYDKLIERCNSELSKLILGATMTTDNGSSKSQGEVHERVTNAIMDSDMRFLNHLVNGQLLPKLKNLGYQFTDEDCFEWDYSVKIPVGEQWKIDRELLQEFEIDPAYFAEKYNVPIKGIKEKKEPVPPKGSDKKEEDNPDEPKPTPEKKKLISLSDLVDGIYTNVQLSDYEPADYNQWMGQLDSWINDIRTGKVNPETLNKELMQFTTGELKKAVGSGLKANFDNVTYDERDYKLITSFQENLYQFAAAKNYQVLKDMNGMLLGENGRPVPYHEFQKNIEQYRKDVLGINEKYNRSWLKTEYNTAVSSSENARRWQDMMENADIFPNAEFVTVEDDKVRDDHAKLHGVIAPLDDAFWDVYAPPLDWNCRCRLQPTDKEPTDKSKYPKVAVKDEFKYNPGKEGIVFIKDHPYFKESGIDLQLMQSQGAEFALNEYVDQSKKLYDKYATNDAFTQVRFDKSTGGYLVKHTEAAKQTAAELKLNNMLVSNGQRLVIPKFINKESQVNFDYLINTSKFEAKTFENDTVNNITRTIRDSLKKGQALNFVLHFSEGLTLNNFKKAVLTMQKENELNAVNTFIIFNKDKMSVITLAEINADDFSALQ